MQSMMQYLVATLLPVVATAVFTLLMRRTRLQNAGYWTWQILTGVVFGCIAIYGTEFGIPIQGATINVRDAAPITAGLLFGGPAGVIAGVIGGVERWFAALWGKGEFTRLACSISTMLAGVYAGLLHHYLFDERKPTVVLGMAIGLAIEVLHLTMVFITNLGESQRAFVVVSACTLPMLSLNSLSVGLSILVSMLMNHEPLWTESSLRPISESIQVSMLAVVIIAFFASYSFTSAMQTNLAETDTAELLSTSIDDVRTQVAEASDQHLLKLTQRVAGMIPSCDVAKGMDLAELAEELGVAEIHVVDADGIIVASSGEHYLDFDMGSGEQSAAFLVLLPDGGKSSLVQAYQPIAYDSSVSRKYAGVAIEDGFVQVGYDASQFQSDLTDRVVSAAEHRHVGGTGFMLIADEEGELVSSSTGRVRKLSYTGIDKDIAAAREGDLIRLKYLSTPCYAMYSLVEGFTIIALEPALEADFSRDVSVLVGSFMIALVFAALFTLIYLLIKWQVVDNIAGINARLSQITSGNLDVEVDVRSNREFSLLSTNITKTVVALKGYIDEAAARIDRELGYAREIQHSALPSVFPPFPERTEFEIFASMVAAKEVGGDFYDFYFLDDEHLVFLIADVSGKGIPAALFMMRAKTVLKTYAESGVPVNEVLANANHQLCEGNDADMFVTAWMGIIDLATGVVSFGNAGHNPPVIWNPETGWSYLDMRKNLILGCMDGVPYRANELTLKPGDVIYLYTDGVVEAMDLKEEQYGDDRLLAALEEHSSDDMEQLCRHIREDVNTFVGEADQFDDMTMLALHYFGPAGTEDATA